MEREIKLNDVFHANYKDTSKSNRCFEGLLVARQGNDRIILVDTFWNSENKWWTLEDVENELNLTYYCNLDDYDLKNIPNAQKFYDKTDYIYMHSQHACVESCRYFYLKKGATKSKDKMIASLNEKIEEAKCKISSANSTIEWALKDIKKIENGELENIYI
ncbi:MAG: hypothetical protein P4L31_07590 [Candidatus Babeliales bacterium]|nr:hypothetical protein [Candidatus Babeliales bacterium]